ncbi:EAL domain-containing protein [Flocculibacter collagenilyticus]|uniref:EAL domain-containing protein n=1 Tax=Flocculibacter collagenilyticus TaxID=2744479 RepID=UPI0018F70FC1|nr:EAL domain-containing protein [Flocculibacter collagenilyticus]
MRKITDILSTKGKWFLIALAIVYFGIGNLLITTIAGIEQYAYAKTVAQQLAERYAIMPSSSSQSSSLITPTVANYSILVDGELIWHKSNLSESEQSLSLYHFSFDAQKLTVHVALISLYAQYKWVFISFNLLGIGLGLLGYISGRLLFLPSILSLNRIEGWARRYLNEPQHHFKAQSEDFLLEHALEKLDQAKYAAQLHPHTVDAYIRGQTFLDNDTGIGNRIFFDHRLEALLNEPEIDSHGAVYLIQLKELDLVQMQGGNDEVEQLLALFINIIDKYLKDHQDAVFARRSDLDFAILMPHISLTEAEKVAEKLVRLCNRLNVPEYADTDNFFHVGVAYFQANDLPYQVLAEADMALRAAQLQGPSNWFMYDKGAIIKDMAKGSVRWRTAIEKALQREAFVMLFQPVIAIEDELPHHNEVLARMRDEHANLVNASVFLPMARKCGLVPQVDKLIITKTIKLLEYEEGYVEMCSFNLHCDSLNNKEFVDWLIAHLEAHPKACERLIVEIQEYYLVQQSESLKSILARIKATKVKLLVDHVGLYVVNTQYIKEHNIDYLKVHRSIVSNIDQRPENQLFIRSLQGACANTQVKIFALGVENEQEWETLKQIGITGAQGHYFTEPLEQFEPFKTRY